MCIFQAKHSCLWYKDYINHWLCVRSWFWLFVSHYYISMNIYIHTSNKYATLLHLGLRGHQGYNFYAAYILSQKMYPEISISRQRLKLIGWIDVGCTNWIDYESHFCCSLLELWTKLSLWTLELLQWFWFSSTESYFTRNTHFNIQNLAVDPPIPLWFALNYTQRI